MAGAFRVGLGIIILVLLLSAFAFGEDEIATAMRGVRLLRDEMMPAVKNSQLLGPAPWLLPKRTHWFNSKAMPSNWSTEA